MSCAISKQYRFTHALQQFGNTRTVQTVDNSDIKSVGNSGPSELCNSDRVLVDRQVVVDRNGV
eukprot:9710507-Alexandrium_andersonii.AAC.1